MTKTEVLTRRERQVMEVIYALGEASVNDVIDRLSSPPSYSAVRAVLTRLVAKGELRYCEKGPRYIYSPASSVKKTRIAALKKIVDTFFAGSRIDTINALMGLSTDQLSKQELDQLSKLIEQAKEKEK